MGTELYKYYFSNNRSRFVFAVVIRVSCLSAEKTEKTSAGNVRSEAMCASTSLRTINALAGMRVRAFLKNKNCLKKLSYFLIAEQSYFLITKLNDYPIKIQLTTTA